jgi:type IV pilus assembly protein PilB
MPEEKKTFNDFLVGLGVLASDQLRRATQEQKRSGERLEQTIVRLGFAKEELILQCLADYFGLPFVDLDTYLIDEKVVKMIPEEMARRHTLIPIFKIGETLTVATANPLNIHALDELRNRVKTDVEIAISTEKKIRKAIDQHYGSPDTTIDTLQQFMKGSPGGFPSGPADYRKTHDLVVRHDHDSSHSRSGKRHSL